MDDYNRGKRDIMLEMAKADLEETASRIAILEEDLFEIDPQRIWALQPSLVVMQGKIMQGALPH